MKLQHLCLRPWHSLEVNTDGSARPCCVFDDRIKRNGQELNIATSSISEIKNSDYMNNLRASFLNGDRPSECNQCWKQEDVGSTTSHRISSNINISKFIKEFDPDNTELKTLGLALGNICNLKCRICGPWASSMWNADELRTMPVDQRLGTLEHHMQTAGSWPMAASEFWDTLNQDIQSVNELNIYGGEPLMTPKHFDMLRYLVDVGASHNIILSYNTNGTQFSNKVVDQWKKFKKVNIAISIDNLENKFEYERKNASWVKLLENLDQFEYLQDQHSNIMIQCVVTVSVFNLLDLIEINGWISTRKFKLKTFWNILQVPEHFSIVNLSNNSKNYIKNKLSSSADKDIQQVLMFMDTSTSNFENKLIEELKRIDLVRNEYLGDTHQELANLLNY